MTTPTEPVIPTPGGGWRVAGTRVTLASVVIAHQDGQPPEAIVANYPVLTVEQVQAAIAFYHQHRTEVDAHLRVLDAAWEQLRQESEAKSGPLRDRLRAAARHPVVGP